MSIYRELLAQREELDRKIEEARREEVSSAVVKVKQLIAEYGLTAADCGFKASPAVAGPNLGNVRPPVAVKYRGLNGETWSGRGKAPRWLTNLEAQGRTREEFRA